MNAADANLGMAWFNSLSRTERARWLDVAGSAVPADAWEAFKLSGRVPVGNLAQDADAFFAAFGGDTP